MSKQTGKTNAKTANKTQPAKPKEKKVSTTHFIWAITPSTKCALKTGYAYIGIDNNSDIKTFYEKYRELFCISEGINCKYWPTSNPEDCFNNFIENNCIEYTKEEDEAVNDKILYRGELFKVSIKYLSAIIKEITESSPVSYPPIQRKPKKVDPNKKTEPKKQTPKNGKKVTKINIEEPKESEDSEENNETFDEEKEIKSPEVLIKKPAKKSANKKQTKDAKVEIKPDSPKKNKEELEDESSLEEGEEDQEKIDRFFDREAAKNKMKIAEREKELREQSRLIKIKKDEPEKSESEEPEESENDEETESTEEVQKPAKKTNISKK